MRRTEREVKDIVEIEKITANCKTCHLAMIDEGLPYVVPLSFGYEINGGILTLYFHSAKAGRKIDILKKNNNVCFEICCEGELVFEGEAPCKSGYYFSSVHGCGTAVFVESAGEKCHALALLMKQQAGADIIFHEKQADSVLIIKISTEDFTGKRRSHY